MWALAAASSAFALASASSAAFFAAASSAAILAASAAWCAPRRHAFAPQDEQLPLGVAQLPDVANRLR